VNTWKATPFVSQVNLAWWLPLNRPLARVHLAEGKLTKEDGLHSSGGRETPRYGVRHHRLLLNRHRREKPCCWLHDSAAKQYVVAGASLCVS